MNYGGTKYMKTQTNKMNVQLLLYTFLHSGLFLMQPAAPQPPLLYLLCLTD